MSDKSQVTCWVVTEGKAGMENQCIGLAEALGVQPIVKRIKLKTPWKQLSPFFRGWLEHAYSPEADLIAPPWPDLLISSGRASVPASLRARRESKALGAKRTITVYIQNPIIHPSRFDLVATPRHDGLEGESVLSTRGSLHRVTPQKLAAEAALFAPLVAHLPKPYSAVVIGGSNSVYQLTPKELAPLLNNVAAMVKETGGSLLVTPSRRTGAANIELLKEALKEVPSFFWDMQTGSNPYYGMLGLAEAIIVTGDSVNMVSEACTTGKPVHILELAGGSDKFNHFHQTLRDDGLTRPFKGKIEKWAYTPLNDVQLVADRVRQILNDTRGEKAV